MGVSQGGSVIVNQAAPSSNITTYTFKSGTHVHLEAVPASGYLFNSWSGDLFDSANPTTVIVDCNKSITANFSRGGFQFRWPVVDWSVYGWTITCLVLAGLLVTVLIVRRGT
ncbi:hypothetical protein ACFLT4_05670 [Chloroflexota bacterium]